MQQDTSNTHDSNKWEEYLQSRNRKKPVSTTLTLAWTSSMYRLPAGSGGTEAFFIKDPTPTLLSGELSYTETRHVTGVVPSGNSRGNPAETAMIVASYLIMLDKLIMKDFI